MNDRIIDLDRHLPDIAAGDPSAFAQWVAGAEFPLRAALHRFAAVIDVEAVLQEALLRTWQIAPRFRPDGKPNGLLRLAHSIAKNLAVDLARRHRAAPADIEALADSALLAEPPAAPDPFLRQALRECQEKLPGKPKKALAERIANRGGEPDLVLARRSKMQLNTFLQNITRARRLLAECLRKRGVDLAAELA